MLTSKLKWLLALLVFFTGAAVRFPEPWKIVGARFALVHIFLAIVIGTGLLFLLKKNTWVALLALGIATISAMLPLFWEPARDFRNATALFHFIAALFFLSAFVPDSWRQRIWGVFFVTCTVALVAGLLVLIPARRSEVAAPHDAFQPSDARTMTGGTLDMHVVNNSQLCGSCHPAVVKEWAESMHGAADLEDPFYMPAHDLVDQTYDAIEPGRYCSACHNPGMMLSGAMVTPDDKTGYKQLRDALQVSKAIRNEGVSCLACHSQVGGDLRGNGSYILTHPQEAWHIFDGWFGKIAERTAIESRPDWHKLAMRPANLDRPEFCASCHTQTVDERLNDFGFLKIRSEYEEWFGGYTGGHGTSQGALACKDCHMPRIEGFDPTNKAGKHRSHRFIGAHTALPHVLRYPEQLAMTEKWLRGEYVPDELKGRWREGPLIDIFAKGTFDEQGALLSVGLTNVKVGHSFPAGTITFADCWVEVVVRDADGKVIFEDGVLGPDGKHTASFRLFGTLMDRHGKLLTKAQTFLAVGMGEVHTLKPGYTDLFEYRFAAKGPRPWSAEVRLNYRKINPRFQAFSMPDSAIALPVVTMNQERLKFGDEVPVPPALIDTPFP